ncbi:MAG: tetratricopeptide repeat protein, partial [Spirochaetota bacterium]
MFVTYAIIFLFIMILVIFVLYLANIYIFPRKLEEIQQLIEAGQTKIAIRKLNDIIEKDDRNHYAHYLLALAYEKENNIQYAILEYRQVLKISKYDEKVKEIDIRKRLASIYKARNAVEEAKKEYLLLTKLDPANYEPFYELGIVFFNAGQLEKAGPYFKKSISNNSKHAPSYYYLGQIHYRMQNYADAKQAFIEAIKIDPNDYKSHYFLGLVLRQLGDYEWAIKEFETAQKSDEIKVKCFLAKGTCFLEREQLPKAVVEFERGLKFVRRGSD